MRLERPAAVDAIPDAPSAVASGATVGEILERLAFSQRLVFLTLGAIAQCLLVIVGGLVFERSALSLKGAVAIDALVGRRSRRRVVGAPGPATRGTCLRPAFAGALGGVLLASIFVAAGKAIDSLAAVASARLDLAEWSILVRPRSAGGVAVATGLPSARPEGGDVMSRSRGRSALWLLVLLSIAGPSVRAQVGPTDDAIASAIARGVKHLESDAGGRWFVVLRVFPGP